MTVPKGRSETVLVVEGDPVLRGLVAEMLAYLGYRVLEAADGRSALAVLETGDDVNLLFTTLGLLCSMTGIDLAEKTRSRAPFSGCCTPPTTPMRLPSKWRASARAPSSSQGPGGGGTWRLRFAPFSTPGRPRNSRASPVCARSERW